MKTQRATCSLDTTGSMKSSHAIPLEHWTLHLKHRSRVDRTFASFAARNDAASHIPRIARPSLWRSLVPRFLRSRRDEEQASPRVAADQAQLDARRTGSSIALLGLVIGSFAINVIALRRDLISYTRNTEAKLGLLREVVKRVKAGEQVDVKQLLGTGDPVREREWEEMIQDLENYNTSHAKKQSSTDQANEFWGRKRLTKAAPDTNRVGHDQGASQSGQSTHDEAVEESEQPARRPAFMM